MLCPWALGFSAGAPFSGGISLGFIGRKSMRRLFINEKVRPKSEEKALFQQKLCCHAFEERVLLQEKNLRGIFIRQRGRKNHFLPAAAKVAT
jgi:hypothetical protein